MATNSFNLLSDAEVVSPKSFNLLSDAVVVPPNSFELFSDALVLPPGAFALTSDALVSDGTTPITPIPPPPDPPPDAPKAPVINPFACDKQLKACLPCNDDPLLNLSTENADVDRYIGTQWPPPPLPPMCLAIGSCGHVFFSFGCMGLCYSTISQADADQCAVNQALTCIGDDPGCLSNCDGGGANSPFESDAQSCAIACSDGGTFTYFLSAGAVLSFFSKADANKRANSLACKLAKEFKLCLVVIGSTTSCRDDYTSFVVKVSGRLTQFPLESDWTISGPGISNNVLSYPTNEASVFGTEQIQISGTPTIAIETYIDVRITDNNTGIYMERRIPVTIVACSVEYGNVTPDINSGVRSYWNEALDIPAGTYRVAYINGAWRGSALPLWLLGDGVNAGGKGRGFYVSYNDDAAEVAFPPSSIYNSQAECEAANAGASQLITHTGGKISMYLWDSPLGDNLPGTPNPTFRLEVVP